MFQARESQPQPSSCDPGGGRSNKYTFLQNNHFEDVSHLLTRDVPLLCLFSGLFSGTKQHPPKTFSVGFLLTATKCHPLNGGSAGCHQGGFVEAVRLRSPCNGKVDATEWG